MVLNLGPNLDEALRVVEQGEVDPRAAPKVLSRAHVFRALDAFSRGALPASLLEAWAEALHTAEDVILDVGDRDFLAEALFELSTPELFGSMEEVVARLRALE
jgi:hypothetical protein